MKNIFVVLKGLRRTVQERKSDIKEIWDIPTLIEKIPGLGAVIDLTNTSRYYDPRELQAAGILHRKILMPGRLIPPENSVQLFMDTVDELLGNDCEIVIGVHCTHGLNRTGYMVCRYMRDRLHIPVKTAIKRFEIARGYKIERDNYIADLLGKEPPPAYFGNSTELQPLSESGDKNMTSRRNNFCRGTAPSGNMRSRENGESNQAGESSRSWRRNRTDSESSYDFKYDY